MISTNRYKPTIINENKEEKNDEKEANSYRYSARFATDQLCSASRITNAH